MSTNMTVAENVDGDAVRYGTADARTECFMGDLKIWPLRQNEEHEPLDPDTHARMDAGE